MKKLSDIVTSRNELLARLYEDKMAGKEIELQYIPTGLSALDKLGLLEKGVLTIIGGTPGAGKTAWAVQLLKAAAECGYSPMGFFFEDPLEFLADRITSAAIGESAFQLRRLTLLDDDIPERLRLVTKALPWLQYVSIDDALIDTKQLVKKLFDTVTEDTGLVVIDYAQAFDAEDDERSVERVIARLAWSLNQLAKARKVAVVLFSQLKAEVRDRGNKWFENTRFKTGAEPGPTSYEYVEGFRPRSGDLQWSSALTQRAKQIIYLFRPGELLRSFGVAAKDTIVQVQIDKGNFGPNKEIVEFIWHGPTGSITEKKGKNA